MNNEENLLNIYKLYPVLEEIDKENKGIIEKNLIFKSLITNQYLETYGERCTGLLFVLKGNIKIQKINKEGEETNLYNIGEGELCHEALSCLLNFTPLNILGKAIQDSEVCVIPFEVVKKYLLNDSRFLTYIYKDLHEKFNFILEKKESMIHESLENRLVKLLLSKNTNIIYSTHKDLAFEINSTREVISRKLKTFEKNGYIIMERGKIKIIKDLSKLLKGFL